MLETTSWYNTFAFTLSGDGSVAAIVVLGATETVEVICLILSLSAAPVNMGRHYDYFELTEVA